jgi:type IV pilus assembly protein PilC
MQNSLAVFSRTLSILISGGIPIPESSKYAIEVFSNKYIYMKFKDIPEKIMAGNILSKTIKEIDIVPGIMKEVVQIGDSSGNLSEILNKNADFFESTIDTKINSFISLIEPIMIVILGGVVTFMLISIYLPIFNSMRVIQ